MLTLLLAVFAPFPVGPQVSGPDAAHYVVYADTPDQGRRDCQQWLSWAEGGKADCWVYPTGMP